MRKAAEAQTARERRLGRALVIDDHPLFCEALSMTLKTIIGIEDVRLASRLEEALQALEEDDEPDIVLLDLNLPDVSGLDGLVRLKTALGDTPVVVVSSLSDEKIVSLALRAGAAGFVPKHSQAETFRAAFDAVARGEPYAPSGCAVGDLAEPGGEEDALRRLSSLTLQQARILSLVCEGRLNKQIAHDLSIAETTVKAHMTAILRKLGVQSRTQAVLIAQEANFSKLLHDSAPTA
ncbi:MAG: response regulator transcription factor [Pseudomonadota bacterium]